MFTVNEAWAALEPHLMPLATTLVSRSQSCGRVLSDDLNATLDVPPSDVSAMDGFAIPQGLILNGDLNAAIGPTIAAGQAPGLALSNLVADSGPPVIPRIMTGAPVPADCDRVVPVELANVNVSRDRVTFPQASSTTSGQHIRRQGEVSRIGSPLMRSGQQVTSATTSLLATHGLDRIPVHRNPSVAYATTGSEIVGPEATPAPGQIRDSHSTFFHAALTGLGLQATGLGIVEDDRDALRRVVQEGLKSDVLLLSGGVSMGEFDLVEDMLKDQGCELLFDSVAIQPGKPVVAAVHKEGLVFGLPGNPASAQITFWLFVEPALRKLRGETAAPWSNGLTAILEAPLPGAHGRDRFLPCALRVDSGQLRATPKPPRGSHDVLAYGVANGLVRIPQHQEPKHAGATCSVRFIN